MKDLIDDCVHCGFCLPSCPTYALWEEEMDSPRGRIVLMKELDGGRVSPELVTHLDRCLGCMACVTACPSGVRYDRLIVQARERLPRRRRERLLLAALTRPRVLALARPLLPLARRLPRVGSLTPRTVRAAVPAVTLARGERRGRVGLLLGCVQRAWFNQVNAAAAEVLSLEGWEVVAPASVRCCGSLHLHQGFSEQAAALADSVRSAFAGCDHIVTTSAGCGSGLKEQGVAGAADVLELLAAHEPRAPRGPIERRVAYHDACHLLHAQGIATQPRDLLRGIPGLTLLEPAGQGTCCGSAGIYNLTQPGAAAALGRERARALADTGAEAIAAANPGCALQIAAHARGLPVLHPVELLAESFRRATPPGATSVASIPGSGDRGDTRGVRRG